MLSVLKSKVMTSRTALVIGATGVTGKPLVKLLCDSETYLKVIVLARREIEFSHPKLTCHKVDFSDQKSWCDLVAGDDLFSAMGTTMPGTVASMFDTA